MARSISIRKSILTLLFSFLVFPVMVVVVHLLRPAREEMKLPEHDLARINLDHAGSFTRSLGHFFRQLPSEDIEREKKKKKSREMGRDQASVRRILTVKTED
ncbi:hypothetical protein BHE74_00039118 [Ensete ventricosum]|nr:hypothetical protein BHE74_00039118 [Ensete ventricosum]